MNCINPKKLQPKGHPETITVGCGKCLSCRIAKRKEWSTRLWHELSYHKDALFLTLTYSDDCLPDNESLRLRDLQLYFKRLRKVLGERRIKYFACGEYGNNTHRPHYHAIVYGLGLDRDDKRIMRECWNYCDWTVDSIKRKSFGVVTPKSINYVAGYIHSKLSGKMAIEQYENTGREPVFRLISQGIGKQFALDNQEQIRENMCITQFGSKITIPRYYINKLELDTEPLKDASIYVEAETVEHYTGLNITHKDLIQSGDIEAEKKYRNGLKKSRLQRNRTLQAQVDLKSSKL